MTAPSTLHIVEVGDSFVESWDRYVENNSKGTTFHNTAWLKLCEKHQGIRLVRLTFKENGNLVGVFPLFIKRMAWIKVAASPFTVEDTPYLGPIVDNDQLIPQVILAIEGYLSAQKVNFFRLISHIKHDATLFDQFGYHHTVRHTHILDLSSGKTAVWNKMKGSARTAIRKSEKTGVRVVFAEDKGTLDRFYELSRELYIRQGKVPPNSKLFYSDICFGELRKVSRLVAAEHNGKIIACAIIITSKNVVYYLDAVSDKNYNNLSPSSGIQWFIIQWAIDNGFKYYDFVGSDFPWIAKFKDSFGGSLVEYSLWEKASPSWIMSLRMFYGRSLKPAWQKVKSKLNFRVAQINAE